MAVEVDAGAVVAHGAGGGGAGGDLDTAVAVFFADVIDVGLAGLDWI
ncbi:hypothetical protein [Nocardia sp. CA-119907]